MTDYDARFAAGPLKTAAEELRSQAARLRAAMSDAADTRHEVSSRDGMITVIVDGRPRVTGLSVDPRAVRLGPDRLGQAVLAVTNQALETARRARQETILATVDPRLRDQLRDAMSHGGSAQAGPGEADERR